MAVSAEWVLAGAACVAAFALVGILLCLRKLVMEVEEEAWIETSLEHIIGPDDIDWNEDENLA